ncbi:MAG: hypothetical protein Q9205_002849 [Flavoplaca limonia]
MLRIFLYIIFFLNISSIMTANSPATNPQLPQPGLPLGIPDVSSNNSYATEQFASMTSYGGRPIGCFAQRRPPLEPLKTVKAMDCYTDIARGLLLGDGVMDRDRWAGYIVPFTYTAASCLIILDSNDKREVDYFSEAEIAHAAAMITFPCVANNDEPLGGRTHIGAKGVYTVTVFGREPPPR